MNKLSYDIKVIDNFLDKDDYNELSNFKFDNDFKNEFKVYHNEINDDKIICSSISEDLLKRLHKNYFSKAIKVLEELSPEKIKLYDYSDFTIIITKKNSKFPIHDDTPNKLLSGVIYLSPESNSGTIFYNSRQGENRTEIDWKTNRAVFFSRREKETWHSYEGDMKNNRVALVYNLMTTQVKEVFEVEKKNYFIGNLRWKLSPHIYKYFKIII